MAAEAQTGALRAPDALPDPGRAAGTADERLPFDHIVVVMMENHSFDNVLGALDFDRPGDRGLADLERHPPVHPAAGLP
jgi:phospholipase C